MTGKTDWKDQLERLMLPDPRETLHQVNDFLRSALLDLRPERKPGSAIKPQDFSNILDQLFRAAECLRQAAADPDSAVSIEQEALEYRGNLEKMKSFLPSLYVRLLAEKSRLEAARAHLARATAWAEGREKTL